MNFPSKPSNPDFSRRFGARRGEEPSPQPERVEAERSVQNEVTLSGDSLLAEQPAGRRRRQHAAGAFPVPDPIEKDFTFGAGSIYGGAIIRFADGKVIGIMLGAGAE